MNALTASNRLRSRSMMLLLAAIATAFVVLPAHAITTPNLLTDPGFESNPLHSPFSDLYGPPYVQNQWAAEMSTIVAGPNLGVTPIGSRMLRMDSTGGGVSQAGQLVDVSAYSAGINLGTATVTASGMFTGAAQVSAAAMGVSVTFYDSLYANLGFTSAGSPPPLDANPTTWELKNVTSAVPVNTAFIFMQVAYNDASIGSLAGFVDEAGLRLTYVPEPTSLALCGVALVGALRLRKRRQA